VFSSQKTPGDDFLNMPDLGKTVSHLRSKSSVPPVLVQHIIQSDTARHEIANQSCV